MVAPPSRGGIDVKRIGFRTGMHNSDRLKPFSMNPQNNFQRNRSVGTVEHQTGRYSFPRIRSSAVYGFPSH